MVLQILTQNTDIVVTFIPLGCVVEVLHLPCDGGSLNLHTCKKNQFDKFKNVLENVNKNYASLI